MRLNNDEYFDSLDKKKIRTKIRANQFKNEITVEKIKTSLKKYESTRHFHI